MPWQVQRLQEKLQEHPARYRASTNWVDMLLLDEHGGADGAAPAYLFLRQAMLSRRALLLLDGLDEGGARRADIEHHISEVLAPVRCFFPHGTRG